MDRYILAFREFVLIECHRERLDGVDARHREYLLIDLRIADGLTEYPTRLIIAAFDGIEIGGKRLLDGLAHDRGIGIVLGDDLGGYDDFLIGGRDNEYFGSQQSSDVE